MLQASSKVAPGRRFVSCGRHDLIPASCSKRSIVGSSPAGAFHVVESTRSRVLQQNPSITAIQASSAASPKPASAQAKSEIGLRPPPNLQPVAVSCRRGDRHRVDRVAAAVSCEGLPGEIRWHHCQQVKVPYHTFESVQPGCIAVSARIIAGTRCSLCRDPSAVVHRRRCLAISFTLPGHRGGIKIYWSSSRSAIVKKYKSNHRRILKLFLNISRAPSVARPSNCRTVR